MWEVIELGFAVINTVLICLFLQSFLKGLKSINAVFKVFMFCIVVGAKFLASYFFSENAIIASSVSTISAFSIGFIFFRVKVYGAGIAAVFCTIFGAISELLAAFVITSFHDVTFGEATQFNVYRLQIRILSILFFLVFILLTNRFRKGSMGEIPIKAMLALFMILIISVVAILLFVLHIIAPSYSLTISEAIPIFSIVIVNIFIFILVENMARQNEKNKRLLIIETQNIAHQAHIRQLMQNHEQIRTMSHNFRQKVHELYTLCVQAQYEELQAKLAALSDRRSANTLVDTGNMMFDSILTSKLELAQNQGINLIPKLSVDANLDYMNADICVLLGNALDNAIEACVRSDKDKFIGLELIATPTQFLCHIKNSIGLMPQVDGEFLKTSKGNNFYHGVGLQSMKQTCDSLGGIMSYDYDAMYFNLWIKMTPFDS